MLAWRYVEVFKLVHNYYDSEAAVNLNFNTCSLTRSNMYKLRGFKIVEFEFRVRVRVSSNFCTFDENENRRVV